MTENKKEKKTKRKWSAHHVRRDEYVPDALERLEDAGFCVFQIETVRDSSGWTIVFCYREEEVEKGEKENG